MSRDISSSVDSEEIFLAYKYETDHAKYTAITIDANSSFVDMKGETHYNACGWLALHGAFHLQLKLLRLPKRLRCKLRRRELIPEELKKLGGTTDRDACISDENFNTIGKILNIRIEVLDPIKDTPYVHGNERSDFTVSLYYFHRHYTVWIGDLNDDFLEIHKFVSKYPNLYKIVVDDDGTM